RSKLLVSPPKNEALWEEYARLRAEGLRSGEGPGAATAFYRANQAAMDEDAQVSWPERFLAGQESGIEYAMCRRIDSPAAHAAEDQNEPLPEGPTSVVRELTPDEIATKLSRVPRGTVPRGATRCTCGVDVQGKVLFWLVAAWDEDFGGQIVDYGAWPRQNRAYYAAADARPSLEDVLPGLAESARLYAALGSLFDDLLGRCWARHEGGEAAHVERLLADANWGASTDTVYQH